MERHPNRESAIELYLMHHWARTRFVSRRIRRFTGSSSASMTSGASAASPRSPPRSRCQSRRGSTRIVLDAQRVIERMREAGTSLYRGLAARAVHAADVGARRREVGRAVFPFQPADDEFNVEPETEAASE